mmetsp:Transcript_14950/g.22489  ORF Transcript_14950/g.22489 Transcript_14950/m.22489 type:complete len:315 (+) Transcript_14950:250-1194(+)
MLKFWVLCILLFLSRYNSTPEKSGYLIINCQDGLSNRLRLLAGYMHVLDSIPAYTHLIMVWDINPACPGHFLQLFEPIHNVTFITSDEIHLFAPYALHIFPPSYKNFLEILQYFHLHTSYNSPLHWHTIRKNMYSRYIPVPSVISAVGDFVYKYEICTSAGMHIRHTDLDIMLKHQRMKQNLSRRIDENDYDFDIFVESLNSQTNVFLMTDNADTQRRYMRKYGSKIIVYANLSDDFVDPMSRSSNAIVLTSAHTQSSPHQRHTTIFHTIVDVLIAAHCYTFKSTRSSSLSELVHLMNMTVAREYIPCNGENMN